MRPRDEGEFPCLRGGGKGGGNLAGGQERLCVSCLRDTGLCATQTVFSNVHLAGETFHCLPCISIHAEIEFWDFRCVNTANIHSTKLILAYNTAGQALMA